MHNCENYSFLFSLIHCYTFTWISFCLDCASIFTSPQFPSCFSIFCYFLFRNCGTKSFVFVSFLFYLICVCVIFFFIFIIQFAWIPISQSAQWIYSAYEIFYLCVPMNIIFLLYFILYYYCSDYVNNVGGGGLNSWIHHHNNRWARQFRCIWFWWCWW